MIRTFIDSDMFLLTLTVGLYCGGVEQEPPAAGRSPIASAWRSSTRRCWRSSR